MRIPLVVLITFCSIAPVFADEEQMAVERRRSVLHFLEQVVAREAMRADNPWGMGHAMMALGSHRRLPDGQLLFRAVLEDNAEVVELEGKRVVRLPARRADGVPVDPHPNAFLMLLGATGVRPDETFQVGDETFTVQDLYDSAAWTYQPPHTDREWRTAGWTLRALSYGTLTSWQNHKKETFSLREETARALFYIEEAHRFITDHSDHTFTKRRQYIFVHNCGAIHLIAGALTPLRDPSIAQVHQHRADRQVRLLLDRLRMEHALYQKTASGRKNAADRIVAIQRLKVFGHALEHLNDLLHMGTLGPDVIKDEDLLTIEEWVLEAIVDLQSMGVYAALGELRTEMFQAYLDVLGDSCHAYRGLKLMETTK